MSTLKHQKKIYNNHEGGTAPDSKKIQNYIYRFCDQIGKGNFSKVYKGIHEITNKQVAIKTIQLQSLDTPRLKQLLNTETVILKILNHPNVIKCVQILSSLRNCYIITELCNGGDLESKFKKMGTIQEKNMYEIVIDVYEGLKYLASKNIVHRDIKASNIFIHNGSYKIADFGFAQISQKQFKDVSVGSPIYMSPQGFIHNIYGVKTDVWSFGIMLFELAEGHTPSCQSRSEEQLRINMQKPIDRNSFKSRVSQSFKDLVIECLKVDHKQRKRIEELQETQWIKKARRQMKSKKEDLTAEKPVTRKMNNLSELIQKRKDLISISTKLDKMLSGNQSLTNYSYKSQEKQAQEHLLKKTDNGYYSRNKNQLVSSKNKEDNIFYSPKNNQAIKQCIKKLQKSPSGILLTSQNLSQQPKFSSNTQESFLSPSHELEDKNKRAFSSQRNKENQSSGIRNSHTDQKRENLSYLSPKYTKDSSMAEPINTKIKNKDFIRQSDILKSSQNILEPYKKYFYGAKKDEKKSFQTEEQAKKLEKKGKHLFGSQSQEKSHDLTTNNSQQFVPNEQCQILKRIVKFRDCIGLIHYCRLSFKLACLLNGTNEEREGKIFFTNWCVLILEEILLKITRNDILFGNQTNLMNNLSGTNQNDPDKEKRRKLKDVTEEYLRKYKQTSGKSTEFVTIKDAYKFIYEFYLSKAQTFRTNSESNDANYYATVRYSGQIEKETRALMQFSREIKENFDGKNIQKLLGMKISSFTKGEVEEMLKSL